MPLMEKSQREKRVGGCSRGSTFSDKPSPNGNYVERLKKCVGPSYFLRGKNFQVLDWVFGKLAVFFYYVSFHFCFF